MKIQYFDVKNHVFDQTSLDCDSKTTVNMNYLQACLDC